MGLGAWLLLVPERIRSSPWLVVTVPTAWALAASACPWCTSRPVGSGSTPTPTPSRWSRELESRDIRYIAGDYWGAYLVDYLGAGRLQAAVHLPVRFEAENAVVNAADPAEVAFVYQDGQKPYMRMPTDRYQKMDVGLFDLYVPLGA